MERTADSQGRPTYASDRPPAGQEYTPPASPQPLPQSLPPLPPSPFLQRERSTSLLRNEAASSPLSNVFPRVKAPLGSPTFSVSSTSSRQASGYGLPNNPRPRINPLASHPVHNEQSSRMSGDNIPLHIQVRSRGLSSANGALQPALKTAASFGTFGDFRNSSDAANPRGMYKPNRGGTNWSHAMQNNPPRFISGDEPRSSGFTAASSLLDTERSSLTTGRSSFDEHRHSGASEASKWKTEDPSSSEDLDGPRYHEEAVDDDVSIVDYDDDILDFYGTSYDTPGADPRKHTSHNGFHFHSHSTYDTDKTPAAERSGFQLGDKPEESVAAIVSPRSIKQLLASETAAGAGAQQTAPSRPSSAGWQAPFPPFYTSDNPLPELPQPSQDKPGYPGFQRPYGSQYRRPSQEQNPRSYHDQHRRPSNEQQRRPSGDQYHRPSHDRYRRPSADQYGHTEPQHRRPSHDQYHSQEHYRQAIQRPSSKDSQPSIEFRRPSYDKYISQPQRAGNDAYEHAQSLASLQDRRGYGNGGHPSDQGRTLESRRPQAPRLPPLKILSPVTMPHNRTEFVSPTSARYKQRSARGAEGPSCSPPARVIEHRRSKTPSPTDINMQYGNMGVPFELAQAHRPRRPVWKKEIERDLKQLPRISFADRRASKLFWQEAVKPYKGEALDPQVDLSKEFKEDAIGPLPESRSASTFKRRNSSSVYDRVSKAFDSFDAPPPPDKYLLYEDRKAYEAGDMGAKSAPMRSVHQNTAHTRERRPTIPVSPTSPTSPFTSPVIQMSMKEIPRDRYGFKKQTKDISVEEYDKWYAGYEVHVKRRSAKWHTLLQKNGFATDVNMGVPIRFPAADKKQVRRAIMKGYPPQWRGAAWWFYADGPKKMGEMAGKYNDLRARILHGELDTTERLREAKDAIERDLHRTFPDNIHFKPDPVRTSEDPTEETDEEPWKIKQLREILQCFALYHEEIGYCQSLNFIAGLLLLFIEDEEKVFIMLHIITQDHLPGAHNRTLSNTEVSVLMMLVQEYLPNVWRSINDAEETNSRTKAHPSAIFNRLPSVSISCTSWVMSILIGQLPIETVLRVWDVFLFYGPPALYKYALAIFKTGESEIKRYKPDNPELFQVIQNLPRKCLDVNHLSELAFGSQFRSLSNEKIRANRKYWNDLMAEDRRKVQEELEAAEVNGDTGLLSVQTEPIGDAKKNGLRRKASRRFGFKRREKEQKE